MPTIEETISRVTEAPTWDQRVAQVRLIPQHHGTAQHQEIYATIAKRLYVPLLAPDFAYISADAPFYESAYFQEVYASAHALTRGFADVSPDPLAAAIRSDPRTLLIFRTIVGFTRDELAHSAAAVADSLGLPVLTAAKIDSMERSGTAASQEQATVAAAALTAIMDGSLFPPAPPAFRRKQDKPDTAHGWPSVRAFAAERVPFALFLHQRHYGGAFRQLLDATSTQRGDLLEIAVEQLFQEQHIPYVRTGAHNQADIAARFEILVAPAPDFVVHDSSDRLQAMLECKTINDGGTARDKAPRFRLLRGECARLGGIPLVAVLGGLGWKRVNDALGPVVRDTDGRVFTLSTLPEMLQVAPFPALVGLA